MTKFNFFLVVEALLLTLGLITIFNNDITSFIFILVLTLDVYKRQPQNFT